MNSLQELNGYSETSVPHVDDRPYSIAFSANTATDQYLTVTEGSTHQTNFGVDIIELTAPTSDVTYTVTFSTVGNVQFADIEWPDLPTGVTVTSPTANVFKLAGINSVGVWDLIREANVVARRDLSGSYTYTSNIAYPEFNGSTYKTWTNYITVTDILEATVPVTTTYDENKPTPLAGYPTIVDSENNGLGIYTLNVYPNTTAAISTMTSTSYLGASINFNANTKVLNIAGTRDQVNDAISNTTITGGRNYVDNFVLTYQQTNPVSGKVTTQNQSVNIGNLTPTLSTPTSTFYDEDIEFVLAGYPQILYLDGSFTLTVTPNTTSAINTISTTFGANTFNPTTKVLTVTGNQYEINNALSHLTIKPGPDFRTNFTLAYQLVDNEPGGITSNETQTVAIRYSNQNVTGMTLGRTYNEDETKLLFSNGVPAIDENSGDTYAIEFVFASNIGRIGTSSSDANWFWGNLTYVSSGNQATINNLFGNLYLYPNVNGYASTTVTYNQYKFGSLSDSKQFAITGNAYTYPVTINTSAYAYDGSYSNHAIASNSPITVYANTKPYIQAWASIDKEIVGGGNVAFTVTNTTANAQVTTTQTDVTAGTTWPVGAKNYKGILLKNTLVETSANISANANLRSESIGITANIARSGVYFTSSATAQIKYVRDSLKIKSGSDQPNWTSRGTSYAGWTDTDGIFSLTATAFVSGQSKEFSFKNNINLDYDHQTAYPFSKKRIVPVALGMHLQGGSIDTSLYETTLLKSTFDPNVTYYTPGGAVYGLASNQTDLFTTTDKTNRTLRGIEKYINLHPGPNIAYGDSYHYSPAVAGSGLIVDSAYGQNVGGKNNWNLAENYPGASLVNQGYYFNETMTLTNRFNNTGWLAQSFNDTWTLIGGNWFLHGGAQNATSLRIYIKLACGSYQMTSASSQPQMVYTNAPTFVIDVTIP